MAADKHAQELEKARLQIARKVRELRTGRRWTQEELATHLQLSQGYLSELERGSGSFTAEQLLKILALFNVPVTHFAHAPPQREQDLQNALARLGALHLFESPDVLPSQHFEEVTNVVHEVLVGRSPRQIPALAPVLVANIEGVNLLKLRRELVAAELGRRLGWLIENILQALTMEQLRMEPGEWMQAYFRAQFVLVQLLPSLEPLRSQDDSSPLDRLDPDIFTPETLAEVRASSSAVSTKWGIVTTLQPQDFVDALRAARVGR
jgi:transcriptional regulator with XRE-family HTH domain